MKKATCDTITILEGVHCRDCGWPVIDACCNDNFLDFVLKEDEEDFWDWWQYCSNKSCINHKGEGVFQNTPDWIEKD